MRTISPSRLALSLSWDGALLQSFRLSTSLKSPAQKSRKVPQAVVSLCHAASLLIYTIHTADKRHAKWGGFLSGRLHRNSSRPLSSRDPVFSLLTASRGERLRIRRAAE